MGKERVAVAQVDAHDETASARRVRRAVSAAVFVLAWIGQFIGHAIEGKRPSFFKDVQFLLIGPIWLLAGLYRRAGIPY